VDISTALTKIHPLAVLLAALATFLIGGLWYSPVLFAKAWMRHTGLTEQDLARGSKAAVFGGAFLNALVASLVLALFLGPKTGAAFGATAGFMVGFGWVGTSLATTFLFERRPRALIAIDAGYHVISFTLMGLILGAMS